MINSNRILSDITPRDFMATYQDTYLRFKTRDDEGWYPAYVREVSSQGDGDYLIHIQKLNGDIVVINPKDSHTHINFDWPELGYVNNKYSANYYTRQSRRQWKKGLRSTSITVSYTDQMLVRYLSEYTTKFRTDPFNNESIKAIFNPKYYGIEESIEIVIEGDAIARAISPDFAISSVYDVDKPVLMYRNTAVGVVEDGKILMPPSVEHIIPMIKRIVPNGFHNSIVLQP